MTDIFLYDKRKKEIGHRIQDERKRLKLTQAELAAKIATIEQSPKVISQSTVASWENGTTIPPLGRLLVVSQIFDCDVSYLIGDISSRKWEHIDIRQYTGLTYGAINALHTAYQQGTSHYAAIQLISYLTENIDFQELSEEILAISELSSRTIETSVTDISVLSSGLNALKDGRIVLPPKETREYKKEQIVKLLTDKIRDGVSLVVSNHLLLLWGSGNKKAASGSTKTESGHDGQ